MSIGLEPTTKLEFKLQTIVDNKLNMSAYFGKIGDLIETAKENLGSQYQTGGTTKSGFDCSGLIYATYAKFDIKLTVTVLLVFKTT